MTKRNTFILSAVGVVLFAVFLYAKNLGLCALVNTSCVETFDPIAENLIPLIPLFILSLITYKMREEVYQAWLGFARWWVPLSMLAILISPEYSGDWLYPITKGSVAFISSALFLVVSLVLILSKSLSLRGKSENSA